MHKVRTRVDELQPGDTVTGTAASGAFEDGPRLLVSVTWLPATAPGVSGLAWEGGGHNVYFDDTEVDVLRVATAVGA